MSSKSPRRSRRRNTDEETFKAPNPKAVDEVAGAMLEVVEPAPPPPEDAVNGAESSEKSELEGGNTENGSDTTSRSSTPLAKKLSNGNDDAKNGLEEPDLDIEEKEEMDPLVITDEPDPELVFEESSDLESGRSSPILTRCRTRRSENRNIPTPKTPSTVEQHEGEQEELDEEEEDEVQNTPDEHDGEHEELDVTFESCSDNVSTKAEAGGDSTRLEYMEMSNLDSNSFLQGTKNKTFGEALRLLSTRRTIRPVNEDYRRRVLQANVSKRTSSSAYPTRNSIERLSVGVKRRSSADDDECGKRFKGDSPGFFSRLTSPLASIRNPFRNDLSSSTPKLTGYKDEKFLIEDDAVNNKVCQINGERRWCSIM